VLNELLKKGNESDIYSWWGQNVEKSPSFGKRSALLKGNEVAESYPLFII